MWKNRDSASYAPELADRLLKQFKCDKDDWESFDGSRNFRFVGHAYKIGMNREPLGNFSSWNDSLTAWSDTTEASKPSAGFIYFMRNEKLLCGLERSYFRESPHFCFRD